MRISGHEAMNHQAQAEHAVRKPLGVAQGTVARQQHTAQTSIQETDQVVLSSQGRDAQFIQEVVQKTPELRNARIDEAKDAVATQTLNLNGQDLADKILLDPLHNIGLGV
jgi:anti-sigma28 factor (negative regulator of flagellin synthesis)